MRAVQVLRKLVSRARLRSMLPGTKSMTEAKLAYLQDEVSQLRTLMRHLVAAHNLELPHISQTRESFDYQWGEIPEGESMLSSDTWRAGVEDTIIRLSGKPREWFAGKRVMDAGCGQGRWTYGFGRLGAASCVSCDQSEHGIRRTRKVAEEFGPSFEVEKKNLLEDLEHEEEFDMVWCFGVLHHTGDTYTAFRNVMKCVKPGGYLFLMIYGEPRPDHIEDYLYYHDMFDMRCRLRTRTFKEKVELLREKYGDDQLHGYFDAISPEINDLYRWDELEGWLLNSGFEDIQRTFPEHPNHHFVARKRPAEGSA